ncbi:MAG: N-acetyltransferase [Acidobacteria bacterium]|nr:N-acetyltransferase [Acidobacteriota bacterium]
MADVVSIHVRPALPDDADAITRIYNEGIRGRGATFETRERTVEEVRTWFDEARFPILVAVVDETVVGWAAASSYRARACYAGIAEYSIYVATSHHGRGVGRTLMPALLAALTSAGFWKVLSRLFPENAGSRALCARFGFREVGLYERHAQLDGEWRDVVIVERLLGVAP